MPSQWASCGKINDMTTRNDSPNTPLQPQQPGLLQECGLTAPHPAIWSWPPDAHLAIALLAALPVWVALGLWAAGAMQAPVGYVAWIYLIAVTPIMEELVFRGLLQGLALQLTNSNGRPRRLGLATLANVLVTAGFVALHLRAQPLVWALAVAAPSLVLGHLRERFSSVWPSVLVHAIYNVGFGLIAWLAI